MTTQDIELRNLLKKIFDMDSNESTLKELVDDMLEDYIEEIMIRANANLKRFNELIKPCLEGARFPFHNLHIEILEAKLNEYIPTIDNIIFHKGDELDECINTFIENMCELHGFTY